MMTEELAQRIEAALHYVRPVSAYNGGYYAGLQAVSMLLNLPAGHVTYHRNFSKSCYVGASQQLGFNSEPAGFWNGYLDALDAFFPEVPSVQPGT